MSVVRKSRKARVERAHRNYLEYVTKSHIPTQTILFYKFKMVLFFSLF